jgi:hypothetical protein
MIQMMVAFRFLQRGVYLAFSVLSKDSVTDSRHLKQIQSQKNMTTFLRNAGETKYTT